MTLTTHSPPRHQSVKARDHLQTAAEFLLARYAEDTDEARVLNSQRLADEVTKNYTVLELHSGWHTCTGGLSYSPERPCPTQLALVMPYAFHPECRVAWVGWVDR